MSPDLLGSRRRAAVLAAAAAFTAGWLARSELQRRISRRVLATARVRRQALARAPGTSGTPDGHRGEGR